MNKIYMKKIADAIRDRIEPSQLPKDGLDRLFMYYALLYRTKAPNVTNENVHDAWAAWASEYDSENKTLVPFNELDSATQNKDSLYRDVINSLEFDEK